MSNNSSRTDSRPRRGLRKRGQVAFFEKVTCPLFLLLFLSTPLLAGEIPLPFDHSEWDRFLKNFVNEKGEVNYRAAKEDPSLLNAYLEKLRSLPEQEFNEWPREEKMALWINAYNAGVIKTVLGQYPIKNIMNVPGGWDQALIQVGKPASRAGKEKSGKASPPSGTKRAPRAHSLNQIENFSLRDSFRDEKILFALSRGARGSSRLRQEAYTGPKLEGQLYLATREFVNDAAKNRIVPGEKKIVLSRLFEWYAKDFMVNWSDFPEESPWNPFETAVLSFLAHYLDDPEKAEFLRHGKYKVKYEVFDWSLNDWAA